MSPEFQHVKKRAQQLFSQNGYKVVAGLSHPAPACHSGYLTPAGSGPLTQHLRQESRSKENCSHVPIFICNVHSSRFNHKCDDSDLGGYTLSRVGGGGKLIMFVVWFKNRV